MVFTNSPLVSYTRISPYIDKDVLFEEFKKNLKIVAEVR